MSIYLTVHSRKFYRNQYRVLFDWFDFIHRCSFHSRWSCQNQTVIPVLNLHNWFVSIPFKQSIHYNHHSIQYSLSYLPSLFKTPYQHSFVIHLSSNHHLTLSINTNHIGLASMFHSIVWSILRMKGNNDKLNN